MKKNLRYIICILLFVMLVSLCACSIVSPIPKGSLDKDTSEAQPETSAEEPVITEAPEILPEVIISEIMASNKAAYADENGEFPDWLELYNYGSDVAVFNPEVGVCSAESDFQVGILDEH